jgi:hypothetical protein
VRAATLLAFLDTPWRFASKQALWRYLGIGLERRRSGNGPERLRVPLRSNRLLKGTILLKRPEDFFPAVCPLRPGTAMNTAEELGQCIGDGSLPTSRVGSGFRSCAG